MAVKKLVEVWDGKNIIRDNVIFLKQKTREVINHNSEELKKLKKIY